MLRNLRSRLMEGLFLLLLIAGGVLFLIFYIVYKTILWVFKPLADYVDSKEAERKKE
jgi:hypothetical protein